MTTVIDASVALKWQFEDEEVVSSAMALLHDFVEGRLELITPTHSCIDTRLALSFLA